MARTVADQFVATLEAAGVKRVYGIVGDRLNRVAQAIDRSAIQWVHMRHEEAGASCGPGSLRFINELYEANRNGARLPATAMVDQFYAQVQARGGGRWDTSSLMHLLVND